MTSTTRWFVLVFGLLSGAIFFPGVKASAGETTTLEVQAASQPVTVAYLTEVSLEIAILTFPMILRGGQQAATAACTDCLRRSFSLRKHPSQPVDPLAQGRQTKRILYIVPNFRAVSADQHLPPQSVKEKLKTATLDSVDYSSFIFVAGQAAVAQADNSYPEFRQGAAGYGRYYWHTLAEAINENTFVEFIITSVLHQDTRYYTLGKGPFTKRLGYAFSRVAITRSDSGHETFNFSEFVGRAHSQGLLISTIRAPNGRSPRPTNAGLRIWLSIVAFLRSRKSGQTLTIPFSIKRTERPSHLGDVRGLLPSVTMILS